MADRASQIARNRAEIAAGAQAFVNADIMQAMLALGTLCAQGREMGEALPAGVRQELALVGRQLASSSERIAAIMTRVG